MDNKNTNEWKSISIKDIKSLRDKKKHSDKILLRCFSITFLTIVAVISIIQLKICYGVEVFLNNEVIAVLKSEDEFLNAFNNLHQSYQKDSEFEVELSNDYVLKRGIITENKISTPELLTETIKNNSKVLQKAASIVVNDKQVVALNTLDEANEILSRIKGLYNTKKDADIDFFEKVEIKNEFTPKENILTLDKAFEKLVTKSDKLADYEVKDGDTLWDIAENNNIAVEKLMELNDNLDKIYPGHIIKLAVPQYVINVKITKQVKADEQIPYSVEYKVDNSMFKGDRKIVSTGQNGKKKQQLEIIEQNGIEIDKKVISEEIVLQPKAEIVAVGTKEYSNIFRTPAYGSITSRFGFRWGRNHEGIDIAGNTGTAIYAAGDGVVLFSGWENGYGKYIVIDHKDGYQTSYGHNRVNLVEKGQKVSKGTKIAEIGTTGNTTGPHVHFEVRSNGTPIDPLKFLQ